MKKAETKKCQSCNSKFIIEPEDFKFYEKIDVLEPTFCPECRMQRRMSHWNQRVLYKRKCDLCGDKIISVYSDKKPFPVYCKKCWWSDKWDSMDYGKEYDLKKPFFEQFNELQKKVPVLNLLLVQTENSDYCHDILQAKDCYLTFEAGFMENVSYVTHGGKCKDCFDCYRIIDCELTYECFYCFNSYKLLYSQHCHECYDSAFLYDCWNCKNCFGCVNLKHKKYHIFNKSYSKEEYEKKRKELDLTNYEIVKKLKKKFVKFVLKFPKRFARIDKSENVSGDNLTRAKNAHFCFDSEKGIENNKFCLICGWNSKDIYDCFNVGYFLSLAYESVNVVKKCNKIAFAIGCWSSNRNLFYADSCHDSSALFGCISLRKKQYCILNKQYSKESFGKLRTKIIQHMNDMPYVDGMGRKYRFGEFFPAENSRIGYNESVAQSYYELDEKSAKQQGFLWEERSNQKYEPTIKGQELPNSIQNVDKFVLKEIIQCQNERSGTCKGSGVFQIIPAEWEFHQKMKIPLPKICSECRHHKRFKQKNPMKLHERQCQCDGTHSENGVYKNQQVHNHKGQLCKNTFQTTYAQNRPEIVYCKECYQKEVE